MSNHFYAQPSVLHDTPLLKGPPNDRSGRVSDTCSEKCGEILLPLRFGVVLVSGDKVHTFEIGTAKPQPKLSVNMDRFPWADVAFGDVGVCHCPFLSIFTWYLNFS
jgi:hypothetical protein